MSNTDSAGVKPGQEIELVIEKIASGGHGLAHVEELPIFVHGAIPGQKLLVRITSRKDRFAEGKLIKVLRSSIDEVKPRCKHFWDCGGCVWQHLPYQKQILYKEQLVKETLEHVTPVDEKVRKSLPGRVLSIIPRPQVFNYRNKLELSFGYGEMRSAEQDDPLTGTKKRIYFDESPGIGFHQPGQWSTVLPIEECHLYDEQIGSLLNDVRRFMQQTNLS